MKPKWNYSKSFLEFFLVWFCSFQDPHDEFLSPRAYVLKNTEIVQMMKVSAGVFFKAEVSMLINYPTRFKSDVFFF